MNIKTTKVPNMLPTFSVVGLFARLFTLLIISLSLTACGFHLRGNIPLSDGIKNMYLSVPNGSFKDELEERLVALGATMAKSPKSADVVLHVTKAESNRTVGTLDERGKVNSYNIRFLVDYALLDAANKPVRSKTSIFESRRYNFNSDAVIEAESEEEDLIEDMEQEAVLKIIRQLAAITDFDPSKVKKVSIEQKASEQK